MAICGEVTAPVSLILPAFLSLRYSINGVVFGLLITTSSAADELLAGTG